MPVVLVIAFVQFLNDYKINCFMKYCSKCKREWPDEFQVCPICGEKFSKKCSNPNCGKVFNNLSIDDKFCPFCGSKLLDSVFQTIGEENGYSISSSIGCENNDKIEITVSGVSFNMIRVNAGDFMMGSFDDDTIAFANEKPIHKVTLTKDFYIGETEVTQELWQRVMGDNPSCFRGCGSLPVDNVSWDDCQVFLQRLNSLVDKNFRLPTEAEWEFAAKGGNENTKNYKYSGSCLIDNVCWFDANSKNQTHVIKSKFSNELGLYDMCGNVLEWCADEKRDYSYGEVIDPFGSSEPKCSLRFRPVVNSAERDEWINGFFGKTNAQNEKIHSDNSLRVNESNEPTIKQYVCRGGSWSRKEAECRIACRYVYPSNFKNNNIGFRLAFSL